MISRYFYHVLHAHGYCYILYTSSPCFISVGLHPRGEVTCCQHWDTWVIFHISSYIVSEYLVPRGFWWHYHMICSGKHAVFCALWSFPAVSVDYEVLREITAPITDQGLSCPLRPSLVMLFFFSEKRRIGQPKRLSSGWPAAIKSSPTGIEMHVKTSSISAWCNTILSSFSPLCRVHTFDM